MRNGIRRKGFIFGLIILLFSMNIIPISSEKIFPRNDPVNDDWLDQENSDWNGAGLGFDGKVAVAQSFVPLYSSLTRVVLIVWNQGHPQGTLTVSIRETLNDTDLTSITKSVEELPSNFTPEGVIWTEFDFPDINVTANLTYYIVWSLDIEENPGPTPFNNTCWGATQDDNYTNGEQWYGFDNYWHSTNPGWDFCFKTYGYEKFSVFILRRGFIIADAKITFIEKMNESLFRYFYYSEDVKKVTVVGVGWLVNQNDSHLRFYMKTFTNISILAGEVHRNLTVSEEYQHFLAFNIFFRLTILLFRS